ncbi:Protease HtpX [subsurface metagenome]
MTEAAAPKRYHRLKLILSLLSTFIGWAYLLLLVLTPLAARLAAVTASTNNPYLHFLGFSLAVALVSQLYSLPLSFYSSYVVEHTYRLSNQTIPAWAWERFKGLLVGLIIGLPVLLVFYYCLTTFGAAWWLPVGIVIFLLSVVLGRLAPVLIFPLFYKFEPLAEDHPLGERIASLCRSVGLTIAGVYRFNLSKSTRKANAAFAGLGRAKRVLLADTLLDNFTDDEILAVVAHELGHFRLKHIIKGLVQGTVITFLGLFLVARLHDGLSDGQVTVLATLPWLALLLGVYSFLAGPLSNAFSRRWEFAADRYAVQLVEEGHALAEGPSAVLRTSPSAVLRTSPSAVLRASPSAVLRASLERLADLNLADRDPHPLVELLFHSHPSIKRRVAALEEL